jgi:hypothetical protein
MAPTHYYQQGSKQNQAKSPFFQELIKKGVLVNLQYSISVYHPANCLEFLKKIASTVSLQFRLYNLSGRIPREPE